MASGALGDPPRDAALHASVCEGCLGLVAARDALAAIDTGLAALPPSRLGQRRPPTPILGAARIGAATVTVGVLGAALAFGASQLIAGGRHPASGARRVVGPRRRLAWQGCDAVPPPRRGREATLLRARDGEARRRYRLPPRARRRRWSPRAPGRQGSRAAQIRGSSRHGDRETRRSAGLPAVRRCSTRRGRHAAKCDSVCRKVRSGGV